ncbi:hypothetical protein CHARACLAT_005764 [Characodon lateralis]|uniref:Uncharacterized protein n=1 Tax=Characodon lateralis TaxID=208331 RepID=A0ABU7DQM4_9TELE|nr:hypothetical protein [Characodon lateralis]
MELTNLRPLSQASSTPKEVIIDLALELTPQTAGSSTPVGLQALCTITWARCAIRDATEEAGRVNRHEGIQHAVPWQRRGGWHHQCDIEKTSLTKGIRKQMDLAMESLQ